MSRSFTVELTPGRLAALGAGLLLLLAGAAGVSFLIAHPAGERGDHAGHDHGAHTEKGEHHEGEGEHHEEGKVKLSPEAIEKSGIEVLAAGPGKVAVALDLPGEVSVNADALAHVTPRVSGTVRTVKRHLGDAVERGEVLATLDSRELAELQREFLATKERLALAEASFKRQEQLWNEKISAEKDYLAARQALKEAQIEHRSAAQKLHAAGAGGKGGAGYALIAPIDGTIIEKHITVGEVLRDDSQAFVIADLSTLWVNVTVYARDLPKVRTGQAVTVRAEGVAESAHGTIAYVGHVVGEQTRSAVARVVLDNPGPAWRPGLFVTAEVALEEVDAAVVVADEAVQTVEGKPVVFVQGGDSFEARPVTLGRKGSRPGEAAGRVVEVLKGLAPGDRYAGKNSFILKAELGKSEAGHEH
ncbi:MAG: efflux RND transporter periplasmic adaptor subunit [Polyangiaceae bacterium]|nr:efflux RND transporter periplasmic adaptor subunit [Polyangiaceae bacterium]